MTYLFYVIFAAMVALYLSMKTDRKVLSFVLILWLLAQPVINAKFVIQLPGLPFDLQPNRILFLFSLVYLLWGEVSGLKVPVGTKPPFEKYIYIYFALVVLALTMNYSFINRKEMFSVPLEIANFLCVYTLAKRHMTEKVFEAIIKAIVLLAVVCAVIAFMQFFIDPMLLRTRDLLGAFADKFRSAGIFENEYDFGVFQILAFIVVLIRYQGRAVRYFIAPLLVFSILFTFHRLDYIILFVSFVTYLVVSGKRKLNLPVFFFAAAVPVVLFAGFEIYQSIGGHSVIVEQRLSQDTVTGRFLQFKVVWESMLTKPLGMGSYANPDYFNLMNKYNMMQWLPDKFGIVQPHPLTVHNGYLAVGIQYGILAMVTFTLLLFSMLKYFKKRINPSLKYSAVPFFVIYIYMLANLSNGLSIFRAYIVVLLAILCGSFVAMYRTGAAAKQPSKSADAGVIIKPV